MFFMSDELSSKNYWYKLSIEILQPRAKFQTSDHRRVCTATVLQTMLSGLGDCTVWKRFTVQTLLRSLKFVVHNNLEHDPIENGAFCRQSCVKSAGQYAFRILFVVFRVKFLILRKSYVRKIQLSISLFPGIFKFRVF